MKILFLCEGDAETRDSWSGVSQSVIHHLRKAGHSVIPLDVDLHGLARWSLILRTFHWPSRRWWVRYHLHRRAFRARSKKAARAIKGFETDIDIVLQVGATFGVPVPPGVPYVLYCDSNIEFSRAGATTGFSEAAALTSAEIDDIREREAAVYHRADLIFTMSDRLRGSFMDAFGIPAERLLTIHSAPNLEVDRMLLNPRRAPNGPPTVLFVGRDFGRKGGDLLVSAVREVRSKVPDARLRIVGARPRGRWPGWIEFTGYLDRDTEAGRKAMDEAYRTSSVFCIPTRFEPFGTSFVEAMAYGLPCVGPDAWAVPEIIVHQETGLLVPPEEPGLLADALVTVLTDHALASRMGRAGRERAMSRFTWPALTSRMVEALEPLVAEDHGRRSSGRHRKKHGAGLGDSGES